MPPQKDGIKVDTKCLVDVHGSKVIATIDGARDLALRKLGRFIVQAQHSIDVLLFLGGIERDPFSANGRTRFSSKGRYAPDG